MNYMTDNENGNSENYDKERSSAIELFRLIFSSRRLETFINLSNKPVSVGDLVVVSADRGEDLGMVIAKYDPRDPVASINGHFVRQTALQQMATTLRGDIHQATSVRWNADSQTLLLLHDQYRSRENIRPLFAPQKHYVCMSQFWSHPAMRVRSQLRSVQSGQDPHRIL